VYYHNKLSCRSIRLSRLLLIVKVDNTFILTKLTCSLSLSQLFNSWLSWLKEYMCILILTKLTCKSVRESRLSTSWLSGLKEYMCILILTKLTCKSVRESRLSTSWLTGLKEYMYSITKLNPRLWEKHEFTLCLNKENIAIQKCVLKLPVIKDMYRTG